MKTTFDKLALAVSLWVVAGGGYVIAVNPERRMQCVLGIAVLGLAWAIRHVFSSGPKSTPARLETQRSITQSIVFAGLLLSVGLAEALGWVGAAGEFRMRASQILVGAMVAIIANVIPKKAASSPRLAALLRANGRALFLGGLGYALAWLLLPLGFANEVALTVMLSALTYVVARIVVCTTSRNRSVPPAGSA